MKKKILNATFVFYFLSTSAGANNTIHLVKANDELKWINMPSSAGKYVVIAGNPKKEGLFVVRVKFPPNYSISPHHHNHYEYDTVISGSCNIAKGNVLRKENGLLATAGTFVSIPPHLIHYGWTGPEGAIIQLSGMGPWKPLYE
jgi:quercetin dioxygenase-like cupin family protein